MHMTVILSVVTFHVYSSGYIHIDYVNDDRFRTCVASYASSSFCECAIRVSDYLEDNDSILEIFLHAKDRKLAVKMAEDLISSDKYNNHVFASRKEKSEFVRGKFGLFVSQLDRKCR